MARYLIRRSTIQGEEAFKTSTVFDKATASTARLPEAPAANNDTFASNAKTKKSTVDESQKEFNVNLGEDQFMSTGLLFSANVLQHVPHVNYRDGLGA